MTGKLGDELIEALGEALAHARGEAVPGTVAHRIAVMGADEVRAIRRRTGMSRAKFAEQVSTHAPCRTGSRAAARRTGRPASCCSRSTGIRKRSRTRWRVEGTTAGRTRLSYGNLSTSVKTGN